MNKKRKRAIKFWVLHHLLRPVATLLFKAIMLTWRLRVYEEKELRRVVREEPRLHVAFPHGCILAAMKPLKLAAERPFHVLTSPSRDGRIGAAFARSFGLATIAGSSASNAAGAAREIIANTREEKIILLPVDGPRGPRGRVKHAVITLAEKTDAKVLAFVMGASASIQFRSWDRMFLPLPFAKIEMAWELVPTTGDAKADALEVEAAFQRAAGKLAGEVPALAEEKQ